ncbi:MAG: BamA/TamA family outer membrane protein [Calditrichaeota bacterium]|nr:BamA/TamA family outer membrane protein [Calditrichota bacterium]
MRALLLPLLCLLFYSCACAQSFVVSKIELTGNRTTKDWVILRELRFSVGDSVSSDDLEFARLRLLSLQLFNNVRVTSDDQNVVQVTVSEQFRFIPILAASPVEGTLNDALKQPDRIMHIVVFSVGGADINHMGTGADVGVFGEFGARSGLNVKYRTRWFSQALPLAIEFGGQSLEISDRHSTVLGLERKLRNNRAYIKLATRSGAPSRLGLALMYDGVQPKQQTPGLKDNYDIAWIAPFVILDRRNLEWYPTDGLFVRGDLEQAIGSDLFTRSSGIAALYLPFASGARAPVLASRLYGGTTTNSAPPWAHYYHGFSTGFRGYSSVQTEAESFLSGECEFRFPITRETSYNVPYVGRYGKDIPFWIGGAVFAERAETRLDGARNNVWAVGAALHVRFPYVQVVEASISRNRDNDFDIVFESGVRF